jgi:hypothetical protein
MIELLLKAEAKTDHEYTVYASKLVSSLSHDFVESIVNLNVSDCYRM